MKQTFKVGRNIVVVIILLSLALAQGKSDGKDSSQTNSRPESKEKQAPQILGNDFFHNKLDDDGKEDCLLESLLFLSFSKLKLGNFEKAIEYLESAFENKPELEYLPELNAADLEMIASLEEKIKILQNSIEQFKQGKVREAIKVLKQIFQINSAIPAQNPLNKIKDEF